MEKEPKEWKGNKTNCNRKKTNRKSTTKMEKETNKWKGSKQMEKETNQKKSLFKLTISHDGIQERLPLPRIESQHFNIPTDTRQQWRQRSVPFVLAFHPSSATTIQITLILLIEIVILFVFI